MLYIAEEAQLTDQKFLNAQFHLYDKNDICQCLTVAIHWFRADILHLTSGGADEEIFHDHGLQFPLCDSLQFQNPSYRQQFENFSLESEDKLCQQKKWLCIHDVQ